MSIFRKVPYIEAKLGALNSTQLTAFKNAINSTNNGDEYYSLVDQAHLLRTAIGTETSYIKAISLQLEKGKEAKSGFVVYAGSPAWCMFLTYNQYGNVHIYEIDIANNTFKRIEEECSIEEVRRVLIDKETTGDVDPVKLAQIMEGDIGVSVDLNEGGTKVVASLDLTGSSAGDVLMVNDDNDDVEWGSLSEGDVELTLTNDELSDGTHTLHGLPSQVGHLGKFCHAGSSGANWVDIAGSDVKSVGATSGQVLTANGSGGASWNTILPALPDDASTKTYTLQAVNGALSWVELQ